MVGNAGHRIVLPLRKRNTQNTSPLLGILVKHFIEIPKAKKQQRIIGQIIPNRMILLHHRS